MPSYFVELHLSTSTGTLAYPILNCRHDTSCKQATSRSFSIAVSQQLLHEFSVAYHHHSGRYNLFTHNCQSFVWFILYSHAVDESQLQGIVEFGTTHVQVETRALAARCREKYLLTRANQPGTSLGEGISSIPAAGVGPVSFT